MYPQWNGQLYGYFPKRNVSTTAEKLVGVVTSQKEQGIMGVYLPKNQTGANKIVLGNLSDTCIGNIAACPTFTVSFLVKVVYPLPVGWLLSFLMSIPRRQSRSNSHAVVIGTINRGFNVSLQAGIGSHMDSSSNEVMDIGRTEPGDLSVWTHVSVVYHGGSHSEHPDLYVNGTKAITIPYEDSQDAQGSGSLLYCVGNDASPQGLSISLLSVVKGELNETQIRDLSESMFQFALQTNQVAVKLSTSNTTVQETVGSVQIIAERTGNIQIASIVRFSAAGSATSPEDYTFPSSEAFIFKPGEIYLTIDVHIISDDYTEDTETFTVSVIALDGVTSTDVQGTVTITILNHGNHDVDKSTINVGRLIFIFVAAIAVFFVIVVCAVCIVKRMKRNTGARQVVPQTNSTTAPQSTAMTVMQHPPPPLEPYGQPYSPPAGSPYPHQA